MNRNNNLTLWTVIAVILVCIALAWLAGLWNDAGVQVDQTQTQNALERTWDVEFHATLTAEAR